MLICLKLGLSVQVFFVGVSKSLEEVEVSGNRVFSAEAKYSEESCHRCVGRIALVGI